MTPSGFSPLENELPVRWSRRLHLVPADGLGAGRRALFFASLTWLPIAVWVWATGRANELESGESVLHHYIVHVRCLVAIPLLILAEPMLDRTARFVADRLAATAIVGDVAIGAFERAMRDVIRLRDSSMPWVLVAGAAIAVPLADRPIPNADTLIWARDSDGSLGFGGAWFAYVARPVFLALLLSWLWRIGLVTYWFWRIGRLGLSLVPTHPDRSGGIGFVERLPGAFALVSIAVSAVIASHWAHQLLHHDVSLRSHAAPAAAFVFVWSLLVLLPLLVLAPAFVRLRARAIVGYSDLVGRQGRLVHRRWIAGERIPDEAILDAPEIGPVADAATLFEAVRRMRAVPIGAVALGLTLVPLAIPLVIVVALQIPLTEMLLRVLQSLV